MSEVLGYIAQNGLQVSRRWKISEEDNTGHLYIRDLITTEQQNIDARYSLRNGTTVNLWVSSYYDNMI